MGFVTGGVKRNLLEPFESLEKPFGDCWSREHFNDDLGISNILVEKICHAFYILYVKSSIASP